MNDPMKVKAASFAHTISMPRLKRLSANFELLRLGTA
jgi:hypothetical protein